MAENWVQVEDDPDVAIEICVFLDTSQYILSKLWGGGVPTSGSGYSWPRICASPQYICKPPYIADECQIWDETKYR